MQLASSQSWIGSHVEVILITYHEVWAFIGVCEAAQIFQIVLGEKEFVTYLYLGTPKHSHVRSHTRHYLGDAWQPEQQFDPAQRRREENLLRLQEIKLVNKRVRTALKHANLKQHGAALVTW